MQIAMDIPVVIGNISDAQIVPEDYQNLLMYYRDAMTEAYFGIGDIAADLIKRSIATGLSLTESRIFEAVGRYCGKSSRTVRYYYETSVFYPRDVRAVYEVCPFTHFVFARSFGESWKDILDYVMENPGITMDALRAKFLPNVSESPRADDVSAEPRVDVSESLRVEEVVQKIFDAMEERVSLPGVTEIDRQRASEIVDEARNFAAISKLSDFVSSMNSIKWIVESLPENSISKDLRQETLADIERLRAKVARLAVAIMPNQFMSTDG